MKKSIALLCLFALLLSACGTAKQTPAETPAAEPAAEEPVTPEAPSVNPDDYLGYYTNGSYDEVLIGKAGDEYVMSVGLYRLTSLDEGTLSFTDEGVVFHTIDASGNPMTLSFFPAGDDRYTLRVDESTWDLLETGTVYDNLVKTTPAAPVSDEQALAAIRNFCYLVNPNLEQIINDGEHQVYWEVVSSDAQQIVVLFMSYTGAQVRYYIDRNSGVTFTTEFVPGITPNEERTDESFNVREYIPE